MSHRYWLVHPNGARQLIDPTQFDLTRVAAIAGRIGGELVLEHEGPSDGACDVECEAASFRLAPAPRFEPPLAALGPLFRARLHRIIVCQIAYALDINARPTSRVLGGYYRRRALVRVYSHDRKTGRRPLEELFDTFLHEIAHHLEYTEPRTFDGRACGRVHGRMHSPLFWRILGELKADWVRLQSR